MQTALVTGAYGFIGQQVARSLVQAGFVVKAIGHGIWHADDWQQLGLHDWRNADVTFEALSEYRAEPDLIVHCAGSSSVAFSLTHPYQDFQRTVQSTLAVLEYMRQNAPAARLVLPSSASVYGRLNAMPIRADTPLNPVSMYGLHKKHAEDITRYYASYFGLRAAIVRLFSVYGIGLRKQLLWDACVKLSEGNAKFSGTGNETRDWIHVEDAAELLILSAHHASTNCVTVNGGRGVGITISDVLNATALAFDPGQTISFNGTVRAGDPAHYVADIEDISEWGWRGKLDIFSEIPRYTQWFRSLNRCG